MTAFAHLILNIIRADLAFATAHPVLTGLAALTIALSATLGLYLALRLPTTTPTKPNDAQEH